MIVMYVFLILRKTAFVTSKYMILPVYDLYFVA